MGFWIQKSTAISHLTFYHQWAHKTEAIVGDFPSNIGEMDFETENRRPLPERQDSPSVTALKYAARNGTLVAADVARSVLADIPARVDLLRFLYFLVDKGVWPPLYYREGSFEWVNFLEYRDRTASRWFYRLFDESTSITLECSEEYFQGILNRAQSFTKTETLDIRLILPPETLRLPTNKFCGRLRVLRLNWRPEMVCKAWREGSSKALPKASPTIDVFPFPNLEYLQMPREDSETGFDVLTTYRQQQKSRLAGRPVREKYEYEEVFGTEDFIELLVSLPQETVDNLKWSDCLKPGWNCEFIEMIRAYSEPSPVGGAGVIDRLRRAESLHEECYCSLIRAIEPELRKVSEVLRENIPHQVRHGSEYRSLKLWYSRPSSGTIHQHDFDS